jgi:ketosteroid isomerase-like protein
VGEQENREVVEQVFELVAKEDWDGVLELFHEDVVIEWPQSSERLAGKEACLTVFRNYPGGFPKQRLRKTRAAGDLVVAEGDADYPDGRTWSLVGIFEFRGGKVARETDYFGEPFEAPEWRSRWVQRT